MTVMTEWLTPAEMRAWRAYIGTYADLANALEGDLAREGVNLGDYQVLVYLSEAPDRSMRMCDLAEHLQLSPSGLTRRLDGLVKSGAVVRQGSESDRRVMMAVLTDVGFATLERVAPHHVASVRRRIFDKLDAGAGRPRSSRSSPRSTRACTPTRPAPRPGSPRWLPPPDVLNRPSSRWSISPKVSAATSPTSA